MDVYASDDLVATEFCKNVMILYICAVMMLSYDFKHNLKFFNSKIVKVIHKVTIK